jgi:putative ubiquitin-RnfH superfamily antitoxin RatB of RatAB toxin-antitoxin module
MLLSRKPRLFMEPSERIEVSVVYALPERQFIARVKLDRGATVANALEASGLRRRFPEIAGVPSCAIFGTATTLSHVLQPGDRVEILRPLLIDPKEARRQAAHPKSKSSVR